MKNKRGSKVVICCLICSMLIGLVVTHNILIKDKSEKSKASNNEVINFKYNATALDKETVHLVNDATYDSNYFANPSTEYNHGLAKLSLDVALASGSTSESVDKWGENLKSDIDTTCDDKDIDYSKQRNAYIVQLYKRLGFYNDEYFKYDVSLNDDTNTSGHSIAMKRIYVNNKKCTLVCAVPRSGLYGSEWASNFYLTGEEKKSGFELAGENFYKSIKEYIIKHGLGANTKVWICGYSRGAGVANIAAACMDRDIENKVYKFKKEDVYAYMCATPMGTLNKDYNDVKFNNIFNIVIESDLVATVPPAYWGFHRYGNVLKIPHMYTSLSDLEKIEKGKYAKLSSEHIELVKKVGYDYNVIRYENAINDDIDNMSKLFRGFAVGYDISHLIDEVAEVGAESVEQFEEKWQGVFVELTPFLINQSRKYNSQTGTWVKYDTLAEYLSIKYGPEIFNKATEAGVFSQTEYNQKIEKIYNLLEKGRIDEETFLFCQKIIDTYYGVRIVAVHNGIDAEAVMTLSKSFIDNSGDLVNSLKPLNTAVYCKNNHFGEFYKAWLQNYNPYTKTIIREN